MPDIFTRTSIFLRDLSISRPESLIKPPDFTVVLFFVGSCSNGIFYLMNQGARVFFLATRPESKPEFPPHHLFRNTLEMQSFFSTSEKGEPWRNIVRSLRSLDKQSFDLVVVQVREEVLFREFYGWIRCAGRVLSSAILRPDRIGALLIFNSVLRKKIPIALLNQTDCGRITPGSDWFYRRCDACFVRELNPISEIALQDIFTPSGGKPRSNRRARRIISWADPRCPERRDMSKLRPISLGISSQAMDLMPPPQSRKKWDLFFAGDFGEKGLRNRLVQEARDFALRRGLRILISPRMDYPDFLQALSESQLCLSPPGMGWDCWRHYEALAAGSVPLMPYPTILQHQPPIDEQHCFYFSPEAGGLTRCLEKAMTSQDRFASMGAAGRDLVAQHHTFPKLREYIIRETLKEHARLRI